MAAGDEPGNAGQQPEDKPRMAHGEYLGWLLFFASGMRFTRAVVWQAVHYAEQVLPPEDDDEGERTCLAAARAWSEHPTAENVAALERAADLIGANAMESIRMVEAASYAVRAARADTPLEAAELAAKAVEDAAGRAAMRGRDDYMGRAVGRRAGLNLAEDWQTEMAWELTFEDTPDYEILPFPPLPTLPTDPNEVVSLFKAIYSEEDAYKARDLAVLLDFMAAEQQIRFKQAAVSQAIHYAEPLLPPPAEDLGERALLDAARRWVDQPTEENARAADLLPDAAQHPTPSLLWTFAWAADTQPVPHATPSVAYVARAVGLDGKGVPHEARMAAAELAQARARQWQAAAAAAIARGEAPPSPDDRPNVATGARGAYLEGRLALLVARMAPPQRLRFKKAVVRHALEQTERVLPPDASDRGHRRCLDAARRWLDDPTEENAKAAWAAAWVGTESAPTYPQATMAESAAWLAARGTAEAAGEADTHRAALIANVLGPVTMVLEGVTATDKKAAEAAQRGKVRHVEVAWRLLRGDEPPQSDGPLPGESFGALIAGMSPTQLHAMAGALERQARWYGERAPGPAPAPWLERPESGEGSATSASLGADIRRSLEHQVEHALAALATARTAEAEARLVALREAAESVWKAAAYAGERQAGEWQVEAAWAILRGAELSPPDEGAVELPPPDTGAHDSGSSALEAVAGSGSADISPGTTDGGEGDTRMAGSWKADRLALQALLGEEPEAQARYGKLADYQKKMCLQWVADAPTPVLREQRICRLARRLWLTSFDPYYDTGPDLMLPELDDLYGPPRLLHHLPPEEQALALEEGRVLGANHYRNYDDAGTWIRVVPPGEKHLDDLMLAYPRPCVLTERTVEWLNRNGWETMSDVRGWLDLPEDDRPPAPPAEPLRIEDPTAGELRPESERHAGPVLALAVASEGSRAVSASADGTVRVWDVETGRPTHVLAGHTGAVRAVVLTGEGRTAVSASADGTVRVWDVETGEPRARFTGHQGEVLALALMPDGQAVVSGATDGVVCVWALPPKSGTLVMQDDTGPVLAVAVTPDGGRVVSASADGTLRVWDLSTGEPRHVLSGHTGPVLSVTITPDGQRAISASTDGTLRVWNLATGRTRAILLGHGAAVRSVALLPDGHRGISASADGTMRVWYVAGALQHILAGHSQPVAGVAVAPQGWPARFVYLSPGSLVLVTGVEPPSDKVGAISASPDGTLRLWNLKTGHNPLVLSAGVPFTSCAISPDGRTFAAGDELGQVHFVRMES